MHTDSAPCHVMTHPPPQALPLRAYQEDAVNAVLMAHERGARRVVVQAATGAGKTVIAAHLVASLATPRSWRTVFMVHRDELVRQSITKLTAINPAATVGVVQAERNETQADIVVASAQTIASDRRRDALVEGVRHARGLLLISDECHHDAAPSRSRAIEALDADLTVGISATPERGDGRALGDIYERIVYQIGLLDLMRMGHLANLVGIRLGTATDLDTVHTRSGEFVEGELETAVDTAARNKRVVDGWLEHAGNRRRTVVFAAGVGHAEHLAAAFGERGIDAACVFGHTPPGERATLLGRFRRGTLPVLVNVLVLTEGYDEPGIDCIVMARPTRSRPLFVQCVGRGARKAPGKDDCLVLDVVDITSRHSLQTLASLAGREAGIVGELSTDGRVDLLADSVRVVTAPEAATTTAVDLFAQRRWVWQERDGVLFAPVGRDQWVYLDQGPEGALPVLLTNYRETNQGWYPVYRTVREVLFDRALPMDMALGVAESLGFQRSNQPYLVGAGAVWRSRDESPTEAQMRMAQRFNVPVTGRETKAQLSAALDGVQFVRALRRAQGGKR